jgi:hypothetical protein
MNDSLPSHQNQSPVENSGSILIPQINVQEAPLPDTKQPIMEPKREITKKPFYKKPADQPQATKQLC